MRGKVLFATALVAMVSLMAVFSTSAYARMGLSFPTHCDACHSGAGTNPVVTLVSNDGTTATYEVSDGGLEWAVFAGATRMAGQPGDTGEFSVPSGGSYTVYAVGGDPGPIGTTVVNPDGNPVEMHTITVTAGLHGSISPGSVSVAEGSDADFSITADPGYHIADVLVDGSSVGAAASHSFDNVVSNHTISATFAIDAPATYAITPSAGLHGSISPAVVQNVAAGGTKAFNFTPSTGYHVAAVLVDGNSIGAPTSYTFTNVHAVHTIAVSFAADAPVTYVISASAALHGMISPTGNQSFTAGSAAQFTITPDSGYHVSALLIDGVPIAVASEYTFANVREAHTIAVGFARDVITYAITPSAGANGSISPAVVQMAAAGSSPAFTFTPDPGFHIADVLVDGGSVGAVGSYTFTNVDAAHTIEVSFTADTAGTLNITPSAGASGTISPALVQSVAAGQDVTFTITPDPGSHIATLTVDGVVVAAAGSFTFTDVQSDHTISVTFAPNPLSTTCSLSSNHSSVKHGKSVKLSSTLRSAGVGGPAGAKLRYEYKKPGSSKWATLKTCTTSASGLTSYTTKLKSRGTYSYRVKFLGTALGKASTSRTVKVKSK